MDSVSQIVLGAACGEAIAGKKIGNRALLWGAIGGTIPDLDALFTPLTDHVSALLVHRGYTHCLLFSLVLSPLLAFVVHNFDKRISFFRWMQLFFWSLITHPLLDAFTGYGTPLFLPFSSYRVDINSIFIIDPVYTLIYVFCLVKVIRAKNYLELRAKWNWRGIRWSTSYLLLTVFNQQLHQNVFSNELEKQNIKFINSFSAPTAMNQLLFYNVTVTNSGYYFGYHSWFDTGPVKFNFTPKNDSLLPFNLHENLAIQKLKRFSKGFYCFEKNKSGTIDFCDVRFGKIGGFNNEPGSWVFKWNIDFKNQNKLKITRGNWSFSRFKALGALFKRIGGN